MTPPRRRRPWRRWLLLFGLLTSGALALIIGAATCRPPGFVIRTIDYERLPADKRAFTDMVESVNVALNEQRTRTITVEDEQVNRWLTARSELPGPVSLDLRGVDAPQVDFLGDNRLRVAALLEQGGGQFVISAEVTLRVTPESLVIHLDRTQLGRLPVPRDWIEQQLARVAGPRARLVGDEIHVDNDFVWPSGRRRFRVQGLDIQPDVAAFTFAPW